MTRGHASLTKRYESGLTTSEMSVTAAARLLAGVHPKVVAAENGVTLRTAYRWRKGLSAVEVVRVDGWTATFARFRYRPPVRISAWERAA